MTRLVSIGNTRTVCAMLSDDGRISAVRRVPTSGFGAPALEPGSEAVHLVSVVHDAGVRLVSALRCEGVPVTWWGVDREIPTAHPYASPERPGADRLVAALAAFRRVAGACIVVDAGTAVTVDAVNAAGALLGGAIAPGFGAMAEGLRIKAPALPAPDRTATPSFPAHSAAAAVTLGVHAAFAGLLRTLVSEARGIVAAGPVVVTGGDSDLAARALAPFGPAVVPELVLEGLAALARS